MVTTNLLFNSLFNIIVTTEEYHLLFGSYLSFGGSLFMRRLRYLWTTKQRTINTEQQV